MRFDLPEYEDATKQFIREVVDDCLESHSILGRIYSRPTVHAGPIRNFPGPDPIDHPLTRAGGEMTIPFEVIKSFDLEAFLIELMRIPNEMANQLEQKLVSNVEQLARAAGNVHDGGGRAFDFDHFIEFIRAIEIEFDEDGEPILSNLMIMGNLEGSTLSLQPTHEQLQVFEELIAAKRIEFNAKKRVRRLSDQAP